MPDILISCEETGEPVPTGLDTETIFFETLPDIALSLVCPSCGQTHCWKPQDAWVKAKSKPPRTAGAQGKVANCRSKIAASVVATYPDADTHWPWHRGERIGAEMKRPKIWYVSFGSRRYARNAQSFDSEDEAKRFAKQAIASGKVIYAGTINPHRPKRVIPPEKIDEWLSAVELLRATP